MSDLDRFEQRIHAHWRKVYRAAKEQPDTYPVARSIASALTAVIKHGGGLSGAREISTCLRENLAEDYAPQLFHVAEDDYPWNGPAKLGNELDYIISAHGYTETGKILKRSAERAFECCRGQNLSGDEIHATFAREAYNDLVSHHLLDRHPEILRSILSGADQSITEFNRRVRNDAYEMLERGWSNALLRDNPKQIRANSKEPRIPVNSLEYLHQSIV